MPRIKPYTTNQTTWSQILEYNNVIPMNQRQYEWSKKELSLFINDIISIFESNKYVEKMGSIIHYTGNNCKKEIWDGQQRTITIILLLVSLSKKDPSLYQAIQQKLTVNELLTKLTKEQESIKTKYSEKIENLQIPKLYCINPFDQEAMLYIINGQYETHTVHMQDNSNYDENNENNENNGNDSDECNSQNEDDLYFHCKHCNEKVKRQSDFIRHLTKQHKLTKINKINENSKIFIAYDYIVEQLNKKRYNIDRLKELFQFIINDIDIQIYESSDLIYVSKIFDWENNRGREVKSLDIVKNLILTNIPDEYKNNCFDKWCKLKSIENDSYKQFGEKIFNVAIQIYNNNISRSTGHDELFYSIINSNNTLKELNNFFKIVEKLMDIYNKIKEDRYGRLITKTPRINIPWDGFMFCLLPIFYIIDDIDSNLILLFVKWYFRNIGIKTRSFNNLSYSNEFMRITNTLFRESKNDEQYNYLEDINKVLQVNIDSSIKNNKYIEHMKDIQFKSTNATYLLYFYETCKTPDIYKVSFEFTLEHIIPQKPKEPIKNNNNINKIGNLTLLEGKNSKNGHNGNSSIQNKFYKDKIDSYKGSTSKITNELVQKYASFSENDIEIRTNQIIEELNVFTDY